MAMSTSSSLGLQAGCLVFGFALLNELGLNVSDLTRRSVALPVSARSEVAQGDRIGRGADQGWKSGLGVGGAPSVFRLLSIVRAGRADALRKSARDDQIFKVGLSASLSILRTVQRWQNQSSSLSINGVRCQYK